MEDLFSFFKNVNYNNEHNGNEEPDVLFNEHNEINRDITLDGITYAINNLKITRAQAMIKS